jgi:hypothetical protein
MGKRALLDVSELGARIATDEVEFTIRAGHVLRGTLNLDGLIMHAVEFRVVHCSTSFTGVEFVEPPEKLRAAIRSFYRFELAGASLQPVTSAETRNTLRFACPEKGHLQITLTDSKIIGFEIACENLERCIPAKYDDVELASHERLWIARIINNIEALDGVIKSELLRAL